MDEIEVKNIIMQKFPGKYSGRGIELLTKKILEMDDDILPLVERYLKTGEVTEVYMGQYTVKKLRLEHGMNVLAAYLTMDWIKKHPDEALPSLEKGHDFIMQS